MSFEKISNFDERKVVRLVEKAICYSRNGMTPTDAMCKAASNISITPELLKRACEAFNKARSVYMLEKTASNRRAEPFDMIDIDAVISRVYDRKSAAPAEESLNLPNRDFSELGLPFFKTAMRKTAAAEETTSSGKSAIDVRRALLAYKDSNYILKNAASRVRQTRLESEQALNKAIEYMEYMRPQELEKTARLMLNRYGEDGQSVMRIVEAKLRKSIKMEKTASYAVFPQSEPYQSLTKAVEKAREYRKLKKNFITKESDLLDIPIQGATVAGNVLQTYSQPLVELSKVPVVEYLTKERDVGSKAVGDTVLDPIFANKLKAIDASQNFIDVASDPHLKNYSINQIADAYNQVIGTMPELQKPRYKGWLSALVRKQLVQGNTFDPNELPVYSNMARNISEIEAKKIKDALTTREYIKERVAKPKKLVPASLEKRIAAIGEGKPNDLPGSRSRIDLKARDRDTSNDNETLAELVDIDKASLDNRKLMLRFGLLRLSKDALNKGITLKNISDADIRDNTNLTYPTAFDPDAVRAYREVKIHDT